MRSSQRQQRRQTWTIIGAAMVALVATSAPDPDIRAAPNETSTFAEDSIAQFDITLSEDAVCDTSDVRATVRVVADPTAEDMSDMPPTIVARVIPDDPGIAVTDIPLAWDETGEVSVGEVELVGLFSPCVEDEACTLGFNVEVTPARSFSVSIDASMWNTESGCAISNPSYGDEATIGVAFQP